MGASPSAAVIVLRDDPSDENYKPELSLLYMKASASAEQRAREWKAELDKIEPKEYSGGETSGLRGRRKSNSTGKQTEGYLPNERTAVSPNDGLKGLKLFLRAFAGDSTLDEARLAEAALIAAKIRIMGRPIWDERKRHNNLKHLNAARFVRSVYNDLIEEGPNLPDGRPIWHLLLSGEHPVWQEALRWHDPKVVQMLQVYVNGRADDLGDAEGLIFSKKVNRPSSKKLKQKLAKGTKPLQLG